MDIVSLIISIVGIIITVVGVAYPYLSKEKRMILTYEIVFLSLLIMVFSVVIFGVFAYFDIFSMRNPFYIQAFYMLEGFIIISFIMAYIPFNRLKIGNGFLNCLELKNLYKKDLRLSNKEGIVIYTLKEIMKRSFFSESFFLSNISISLSLTTSIAIGWYILSYDQTIYHTAIIPTIIMIYFALFITIIMSAVTIFEILFRRHDYVKGKDRDGVEYNGILTECGKIFSDGRIVAPPKSFEIKERKDIYDLCQELRINRADETSAIKKIIHSKVHYINNENKIKKEYLKFIKLLEKTIGNESICDWIDGKKRRDLKDFNIALREYHTIDTKLGDTLSLENLRNKADDVINGIVDAREEKLNDKSENGKER